MRRKFQSLITILIITALAFGYSYAGNMAQTNVAHPSKALKGGSSYETAVVIRVVDGDTIVAKVNSKEQKIRMIGVNTPESVGAYADDPQPGGVEASNFTKSELKKGETIYLTRDVSNTDKYGRLLRYIWIDIPNEQDVATKMFNAILLEEGYADVMRIPPDTKYANLFETLDN